MMDQQEIQISAEFNFDYPDTNFSVISRANLIIDTLKITQILKAYGSMDVLGIPPSVNAVEDIICH